jgi:HK97 family phage portal protein
MKLVIELEDGTVINSHPVLDLLKRPSPYYTKKLFLDTLAKNFLITGETHLVALGGITRPPLELQPISPDKITLTEGDEGLATSVIVSGNTMSGQYVATRDGKVVKYLRDGFSEIHMTRSFKTQNNSLLRGESLLVSASSEVRQHILGGTHNVSLLEKGGRVSMIFHFKEDMSDDDFKTTQERVRAQYGGASNAGEIGVTAGDGSLEIKEAGSKNVDMDFANLQKMAKVAVANQYGFPLVLLDTDAATFNNYEVAKEALYDDAALPFADVIFESLSEFLLPRYGEDPAKMRIVADMDSIPALVMRRNKELKLRKEIGIESINELRSSVHGRDDVEGGDDVLVPANLVPVGQVDLAGDLEKNPSAFPKEPVKDEDDE